MRFLCHCGHVIKDTVYPSPHQGDLKWQTESERASDRAFQALSEFLIAVEKGEKKEWWYKFCQIGGDEQVIAVRIDSDGSQTEHTADDYYRSMTLATMITDIISRFDQDEGHSVHQCPKCGRLYVQKEYRSDEYSCFEKRPA